MNEPIKTTHNGIEIVYDEPRELWRFTTDDGVERSAQSLAFARKAIDNPRKSKSKFKSIPIYYINLRKFVEANVTSFAEQRWSGSKMARVSYKDGHRQCLTLAHLETCLPRTERNRKLIEEWQQLLDMADSYKEKAHKLMMKAEKLTFPEESNAD